MQLPPLTDGIILKRYKRFFADVQLGDGRLVTAHCPNTGSMVSCWEPGAPVQLSHSDNPRRKLAWTLERVDMGAGWVGVNTHRVNPVIAEALEAGSAGCLRGYTELRREVTVEAAERSRLDFLLSGGERPDAYIEVKSVTLWQEGRLCFPDAVTSRGLKHLHALAERVAAGYRGVMIYALNRPEGDAFHVAEKIDPAYAAALREVVALGVEPIALRIGHGTDEMRVVGEVPVRL